MNTVITSKEAILNISRQLIQKQGCTAINIRNVAAACGVSVGSIYNYFNSKSDLMAAVIESVWHDIFHFPDNIDNSINFLDCVSIIFNNIQEGVKKYPAAIHTIHAINNNVTFFTFIIFHLHYERCSFYFLKTSHYMGSLY